VAVAHQRNFLVEHHFARITPPVAAAELWDAGACVVLERADFVAARGAKPRAELLGMQQRYEPHDALTREFAGTESLSGVARPPGERGPALLFTALADAVGGSAAAVELVHRVHTRDHVSAQSRWQVLP
jgi:hypothetical protein